MKQKLDKHKHTELKEKNDQILVKVEQHKRDQKNDLREKMSK